MKKHDFYHQSKQCSSNSLSYLAENRDSVEDERLTLDLLTKTLDSLKIDIFAKIESAFSGLQSNISAIREDVSSSQLQHKIQL